MDSGPDAETGGIVQGPRSVDARGAWGVQSGEHNTQVNYFYQDRTWHDRVGLPPLTSVTGEVDSPYRGLGAFREQDSPFFFGRDEAAGQVLDRMSRLADGRGMLIVTGASGVGKSSLIQAGVLPRLRGEGLTAARDAASWPCVVLAPGRKPLDELALRVALVTGADAGAVRRELRADPAGFALTARQAALALVPGFGREPGRQASGEGAEPRLILIVDQFEQVFTQCREGWERDAFITALHVAAGGTVDGRASALIVLGMRADFDGRCASYPELSTAAQSRYLVTPLTERQLRLAITGPADKAGGRVEEDLTRVLLAEAQSQQRGGSGPGLLPLLSHALDQAWRSRTGPDLTLADYERIGGIEEAVAASAGRAYESLTPVQRDLARQVFTRLVSISSSGADTADRCTITELTVGEGPDRSRDVEAVLEAFVAERLLTVATDSAEISHEVLLTSWPLLQAWLADTHGDRLVLTRLRGSAAEWSRTCDPSYLYRGTLLQAALETVARAKADPRSPLSLGELEERFLEASGRARTRSARRRRAAVGAMAALTLIAVTIAGVAVNNAADANRQRAIALSRQLASESLAQAQIDPQVAGQLAATAWKISPTEEAHAAMLNVVVSQQEGTLPSGGGGGVNDVAFSPNGKLLATADGGDETVRLWNPATDQVVGRPLIAGNKGKPVFSVAFSPDGRLLASAGKDGLRLWNLVGGRAVGRAIPAGARKWFADVAFSPNGRLLATVGENGTTWLWDAATGREVGQPLPAGPNQFGFSVAFSPDGKLLATAYGGGIVRLWNPGTGRTVGKPLVDPGGAEVNSVAFSPNGRLLATAGVSGSARLWDLTERKPTGKRLYSDPSGAVWGVAFSPNSGLIATAGGDGTARLWNTATGKAVGYPMHVDISGPTEAVAFSPDGKLLATAEGDGMAQVWNAATDLPETTSLAAGRARAVAFNPVKKKLAVLNEDGAVRMIQDSGAGIGRVSSVLRPVEVEANDVAFSPDGKTLATPRDEGVQLWNTATGRAFGKVIPVVPGRIANSVAYSPDGKLLAVTDEDDGNVYLWNLAEHRAEGKVLAVNSGGGVDGVVFSPNGKTLATVEYGGTVQLWDLATRKAEGNTLPLKAGDGAFGVAFSPDGTLLATAGSEGEVRLWDVATGQALGGAFPVTRESADSVAFSPDGKTLATAASGTVQLWKIPMLSDPYRVLCADFGPLTQSEWEKYSGGEPLPAACS